MYLDAPNGSQSPARRFPPPGWPDRDSLLYVKDAITALLLVLALPWLAYQLVTKPGAVLAAVGKKHAVK